MGPLIRIALVVGPVWLAGYMVACWIFPFAACRKCKGVGKFKAPNGKTWRRCRRCKGSGERLRVGRKIWNYYRKAGADR